MKIGPLGTIKILCLAILFIQIGCTLNSSIRSLGANFKSTSPSTPISGTVTYDSNFYSVIATPTFDWSSISVGASISHYEIALGTSAGDTSVVAWTDIGMVTTKQITGVSLVSGTTYFANVRAVYSNGSYSNTLSSSGWKAFDAPSVILALDDDIAFPSLTTSPTITWNYPGTLVSGAMGFEFQIAFGSTPGGTNILNWTSTGTAESYSNPSLSLTLNSRVYATVRVRDSSGTVYQTLAGDGWLPVTSVTSSARYSIAPDWNQFALASNTTLTCATGSDYFSCIHGGESRRVNYPAAANCTNLTASDSLDAFYWSCDDSGGAGNVFFFTRSLKSNRGLADLVTATSWKNIRAVIFQSGTPVAASAYTTWWSNPVQNLPGSVGASGVNYTIYTVSSNRTDTAVMILMGPGFSTLLGAAVVVLNDYTYTASGLGAGSLLAGFCRYCWFEGTFLGVMTSYVFNANGITQSTFRNIKASSFGSFVSNGPMYSYLTNINTVATSNWGIMLELAQNNVYENIHVDHSSQGIFQSDNESNNVFIGLTLTHLTGNGLYFYTVQNTHYIGVTIADSSALPINMLSTTNTVLKNIALVNNVSNSISTGSDNRLTVDNFVGSAINLGSTNNSKFTNNIIFSSTPSCTVTGGTSPGLTTTTCANNGASDSVQQTSVGFGLTSFVGMISSDDTKNQADTNGAGLFTGLNPIDWISFDNFYRSWSVDATPGTAAVQGRCTSGPCRIYDYSLKASDTVLKNSTVTGLSQNAAFVNGAACPAQLHGNQVVVTAKSPTPITYLKNAREIMGTGGNNNGLCESNESCLYMPNFGAYQGSGDFWSNTCTFTNGTVTGVKIYAYPVN